MTTAVISTRWYFRNQYICDTDMSRQSFIYAIVAILKEQVRETQEDDRQLRFVPSTYESVRQDKDTYRDTEGFVSGWDRANATVCPDAGGATRYHLVSEVYLIERSIQFAIGNPNTADVIPCLRPCKGNWKIFYSRRNWSSARYYRDDLLSATSLVCIDTFCRLHKVI